MDSLFIEFYGLPGCGKSTISHRIANRLRDEGYTVDEPSFKEDHQSKIKRIIAKLLIGCVWFVLRFKSFREVSCLVRYNGYQGLEWFTQTVNILQKIAAYRKNSVCNIVILDQGVIQAAVSLSITEQAEAYENYLRIENLISRRLSMIRVYMALDKIMALERMAGRNTNDSRVERVDGYTNKLKMLDKFENGFKSIRDGLKEQNVEIVADGANNVEIIVDYIYQAINNNINECS